MALLNMKNLKGKLQDAADSAASAVKDSGVQEKLAGIKVTDKVTGFIDTAKDGAAKLAEIKVPDQIGNLINTVKGISAPGRQHDITQAIPVSVALSIFYYLMSADGTLRDSELELFDSIFDEMGGSCSLSKEDLTLACQAQLEANASSISPLIPAMTCVDQTLLSAGEIAKDEVTISPKLLVWDLIAIAHSDGGLDATERELKDHIARQVDVNETTLLEMESAALTIYDIERELNWVKTTNRPYLVIEQIVNKLESRKAAAFEGAQALITL